MNYTSLRSPELEIGGDFHRIDYPDSPLLPWPQSSTWFALGSDAVLAVWSQLPHAESEPANRVLWVPDYFCTETTGFWERGGVVLRRYADDPRWSNPDWRSLQAVPGDLVLAVNYFGVRESGPWRAWRLRHSAVTLIEDHTHDPLSDWAVNSETDYAFASVRKTHPVPDGGILWSPRGRPLPPRPYRPNWSGSLLKLAAMLQKAAYLESSDRHAAAKEAFRKLQAEGEEALAKLSGCAISPWSRALLARGSPDCWRQQREDNVRFLLGQLPGRAHVQPLFTDWPSNHCPFNVVLLFPSGSRRDAVRAELIANGVYSPIHWEQGPKAPARCVDLSRRILTVPADQRYDRHDMARIASLLCGS